jgi:hypothetical protein
MELAHVLLLMLLVFVVTLGVGLPLALRRASRAKPPPAE